MKLKPEFSISKKHKDKNKDAKDGDKKKTKKQKNKKPKTERGRSKEPTPKPIVFAPKKKKNNKKRPISRDSSISTVSRGRSPKRRAGATDTDDATSTRTSARDSSIRSLSSRASSFSDIESQDRPWKAKKNKEPIVYSCCGFCSLGAGSLLTALIYVGLCIGFLVYRIGSFTTHMDENRDIIWSGENLFLDIWILLIIAGMATAGISMFGALVLLVASCVWGQKEHYKKMRNAVIIWSSLTAFAIIGNLGEAIYSTVIPDKVRKDSSLDVNLLYGKPINIEDWNYEHIKDNLKTIWGLTGTHTIAYFYLLIVLISYLRLLKYKSAPKVGSNQKGEDDESSIGSTGGRSKSFIDKSSSRGSLTSSFKPTSQSRASSLTTTSGKKKVNNSYMNWPMTNGAYSPDSVTDMTSNDDTQTLASSFYDMPPGNIYDETPETDNVTLGTKPDKEKAPAPLPKDHVEQEKLVGSKKQQSIPIGGIKTAKTQPTNNLKASTSRTSTRSSASSNVRPKKQADVGEKPEMQPEAVTSFFKRLHQNETTPFQADELNPMEEMFRLFGGDLCAKHPENCDRYLKSYKDIRSKTSHLNSMRDPYDFEGLGKSAAITPEPRVEQFNLEQGPYSLNTSLYGSFGGTIPHHQSISADRPNPVYGFRPQNRGEPKDYPRYPQPSNRVAKGETQPRNGYRPQYPFTPSESIYYDEACSTCYGDFLYGDYGSYYSWAGGYPPPPNEPPPVYTPTPPRPYDPSMQQFSAMSDIRRPRSKANNPTWFPLNSNDDYSTYMPSEDYSLSTRTRSLPNLAASASKSRPSSLMSDEIVPRRPMRPEITIPSPREARKLSRSSSWSKESNRNSRDKKKRSSSGSRSRSLRNYNGYHSGDLRRRTSYTTDDRQSFRSERPSTRNSGFTSSRPVSRISGGPRLPPRDIIDQEYEEMGSVYSFHDHHTGRTGRPSTRTRAPSSRPSSGFSQSIPASEQKSERKGYPDREKTPSSILRRTGSSLDRSRTPQSQFDDDWEPRQNSRQGRRSSQGGTRGRLRSIEDPATGRSLSRDRAPRERSNSRRSKRSWSQDMDVGRAPKNQTERRRSFSRDRGRSRTRDEFEGISEGQRVRRSSSGGRRRSKSRDRGRGEWFDGIDEVDWMPKGRSRSQDRGSRRSEEGRDFRRTKSFRSNAGSDGRSSTKQVKFGSTPNLHHI